jgi:hypothetical protein
LFTLLSFGTGGDGRATRCETFHMQWLGDIEPTEIERLIAEMVKLRRAMVVGNFTCLVRELEKRSFARPVVQFVIGLCAVYWGRAELEDLEFDFRDELDVLIGDEIHRVSLSRLRAYAIVAQQSSSLGSDWLNCIVRQYSTEFAEIVSRMPIIGEIELSNPSIRVDAA